MIVRVRVKIHGLVQGVGFRFSTAREAERLALDGWVKNLLDGSVQFEAEGEDAAVDALVEWAHQGPVSAWVSGVRVREVPARGAEADGGFAIAG